MPEATRRKGFPAPGALAAAALLHAVILALLLPWPLAPQRSETARAVPVTLVRAPPHRAEKPPQPPVSTALANKAAPPVPPSSAAPAPAADPGAKAPGGLQRLAEAPPSAATEPKPQPPESGKAAPTAKLAPSLGKHQNKSAKRPGAAAAGARIPGAAVYGVVLAAAGVVDSITLLQSSGRADFDAAGEQMVRRSILFSAPQSRGEATRYFTVTLRFTPDHS